MRRAHERGVKVVPFVGPSSILLALMASGMNGQSFAFNGYLPVDAAERGKRLRELEALSRKANQTQIFIETPYRNRALLDTLLATCAPSTLVCVAVDLTLPTETIVTPNAWRSGKRKPRRNCTNGRRFSCCSGLSLKRKKTARLRTQGERFSSEKRLKTYFNCIFPPSISACIDALPTAAPNLRATRSLMLSFCV